ncbi:MAG: GNAT family N-acetyltransferase [Alphaproteobacteria bacterium]|nr:GNAT family N-acetyltransferase [Alphaproteobacteria bacterium]
MIKIATTDADIARLFPLLRELRPHLKDEADLLARAARQKAQSGWQLIYAEDAGVPVAAAGFRISEWLAWGKTLYVDDLICRESHRGKGFARALLRWMEELARRENCAALHLDSGTQRTGAHHFYFRQGLSISSFHFSKQLGE